MAKRPHGSRRMFALLSIGAFLVLWPVPALATTYTVTPDATGDFPTIQAAIDGVLDGDVIELTDGTFTGDDNRDVNFRGKRVTVRSQSGNPSLSGDPNHLSRV